VKSLLIPSARCAGPSFRTVQRKLTRSGRSVSPGRNVMSMQHEAFAEANVLKERAAAHYVGVSLSTLRRRRASRRRPAFIQIDRSIGCDTRAAGPWSKSHGTRQVRKNSTGSRKAVQRQRNDFRNQSEPERHRKLTPRLTLHPARPPAHLCSIDDAGQRPTTLALPRRASAGKDNHGFCLCSPAREGIASVYACMLQHTVALTTPPGFNGRHS
jgi:hypothetical protein